MLFIYVQLLCARKEQTFLTKKRIPKRALLYSIILINLFHTVNHYAYEDNGTLTIMNCECS